MERRTVLTEMFVSIHSDITEMQIVIRCTITGNIHTKHVASTKVVKAENINRPTIKTMTPAFYCTLCGKAYHDALNCRAKDSIYANHTGIAYIGSAGHQKLQMAMGNQHNWIPNPASTSSDSGHHKRKGNEPPPTAPASKKLYAKKDWKDKKGDYLSLMTEVLP